MNDFDYRLDAPRDGAVAEAAAWLWLGVGALTVSGLFVILVVLARMPFLQDAAPLVDFFRTALVVHVDFAVLVWFVAFSGVIWALNATERGRGWGRIALGLAVSGSAVMAVSPFLGETRPFMNNYVPVLRQPAFMTGLALLGLGGAFLVLRNLLFSRPVGGRPTGEAALRFGISTSVVAGGMVALSLAASYAGMPDFIQGREYYEVLFWGGGHVLQLVVTQLMLVAWLWLANAAGAKPLISPRITLALFAWGMLSVFLTPVIYLSAETGSALHRELFTWQMAFGGSLAALPIGLAVTAGLVTAPERPREPALAGALAWSIALFGFGGALGFMIDYSDVTVPAHYHGCIVGITLAFMGLTYHLLPKLGYAPVNARLANWQTHLYGVGQMLHVSGLAWAGRAGVQRKTAGAEQMLDSTERLISMGIMGIGALLSVVGGVLFLVLVIPRIARVRASAGRPPVPVP